MFKICIHLFIVRPFIIMYASEWAIALLQSRSFKKTAFNCRALLNKFKLKQLH